MASKCLPINVGNFPSYIMIHSIFFFWCFFMISISQLMFNNVIFFLQLQRYSVFGFFLFFCFFSFICIMHWMYIKSFSFYHGKFTLVNFQPSKLLLGFNVFEVGESEILKLRIISLANRIVAIFIFFYNYLIK